MFDSLGRGWKMIMASIRMGMEDKRLLLPSIITVFVNFFFGLLLMADGAKIASGNSEGGKTLINNSHNLIKHLDSHQLIHMSGINSMNGFMEQSGLNSGLSSMMSNVNGELCWSALMLLSIWWLINRFLEGVTTAMVYSHLTAGPGSGKFKLACKAVIDSAPALICLGLATAAANSVARFLKNKENGTNIGFGLGFLASMVQIFWTLAGHLLLPAIVIEGCSFFGALKRADKIASGNLLTIGFGEVGIDKVAAFSTLFMGAAGASIFGYAYLSGTLASMVFVVTAFIWVCFVILMTAAFMYIRSAFYTCLYVWAVEAEGATEIEKRKVAPPAPLAAALA